MHNNLGWIDDHPLPSHISHALPSLDVNCFKPFKTTSRKEKNNTMVRNNHYELDKCTFINLDKDLDLSLSK